jgi:hypothetical protein
MLVIANREPTLSFDEQATEWLNDAANNVHFNVAVITRSALFDLYGDVLQHTVAFTI